MDPPGGTTGMSDAAESITISAAVMPPPPRRQVAPAGASGGCNNSTVPPSSRHVSKEDEGAGAREKVELKPGYSQVSWMRLADSGADLRGPHAPRSSRMPKITMEELKKHNKKDDAWMALKGHVYNITPYLDYHPGGVPKLMSGAGKDGTSLFAKYHPWVNYQALLGKCLVGILDTDS
eukprot:jgi/Mesvir1/24382/Mv11051-RA.1